jgi:hypothetical protein
LVLLGLPLRTEAKVFHAPARYSNERGAKLWEEFWQIPALAAAIAAAGVS